MSAMADAFEELPPDVQARALERPSTLLPPWPDDLVTAKNRAAAVGWCQGLPVPGYRKRSLLYLWANYTGVRLLPADVHAMADLP